MSTRTVLAATHDVASARCEKSIAVLPRLALSIRQQSRQRGALLAAKRREQLLKRLADLRAVRRALLAQSEPRLDQPGLWVGSPLSNTDVKCDPRHVRFTPMNRHRQPG